MATTVRTFTNATGTLQPFLGSQGKMIDNFSSSDLEAGYTDPYQGIAFRKIESVQMTVGGTSGTANAGRMGIWKSANTIFDYASITLNGVTATSSSATASVTATVNAVIASGVTYYAGVYGSSSIAAKRDTNTGSFSSYTGGATSATVGSTYNPGNLNFVLKYYYLPNGPAAPTITSKTSTSVTIAWTAPTDPGGYAANTLRYKVKWTSASGGSGVWTEETAVNALSATITGLTPGETYQFYVAAMNAIVPTTGNSYTSSDSSVYIDWYSSGPWSNASVATQLNGGVWNGTAWKPMTRLLKNQSPTTAFTNGSVAPLSTTATVTVASTNAPASTGDPIVISGSTGLSGFNGTWTVGSVGGSTGAWTVSFACSYFNSNPTTPATLTTQGTITGYKRGTLKVYDSANAVWNTLFTST